MVPDCQVCGATATHLWGTTPLCDNPACEQHIINEVNFEFDVAAREAWEEQMAREFPVPGLD